MQPVFPRGERESLPLKVSQACALIVPEGGAAPPVGAEPQEAVPIKTANPCPFRLRTKQRLFAVPKPGLRGTKPSPRTRMLPVRRRGFLHFRRSPSRRLLRLGLLTSPERTFPGTGKAGTLGDRQPLCPSQRTAQPGLTREVWKGRNGLGAVPAGVRLWNSRTRAFL